MRDIEVFTVRDLRLRSSELVREAEGGQVSIITKRGKPAVLALPFDGRLLDLGVDKDLAITLFERRLLTLGKAAKLAGVTQDAFMDVLEAAGIVAVDYPQRNWTRSCRSRSDRDDRPIPGLDTGEWAAIRLARHRGILLLIDERRGRAAAHKQGVEIIGTGRVLIELIR